jgi:hypothetical protein
MIYKQNISINKMIFEFFKDTRRDLLRRITNRILLADIRISFRRLKIIVIFENW